MQRKVLHKSRPQLAHDNTMPHIQAIHFVIACQTKLKDVGYQETKYANAATGYTKEQSFPKYAANAGNPMQQTTKATSI